MKLDKPTLLSDCGTFAILDEVDKYGIDIQEGSHLIIEVGAFVGKAAANLYHPNIVCSVKRVYEFKHYRKGGGKYWTSKAGISHYIIVPKNKITLLPEKGYSYIKAIINGVNVIFNVSGGGGSEGWMDWLHTSTQISVNHKLADIKKLCEVAERGTAMEAVLLEYVAKIENGEDRLNELERWKRIAAQADKDLPKERESLLKQAEKESEKVTVVLKDGYRFKSGKILRVFRKGKETNIKKNPDGSITSTWDFSMGRFMYVTACFEEIVSFPYKVKNSQIDWAETIKANKANKEIDIF